MSRRNGTKRTRMQWVWTMIVAMTLGAVWAGAARADGPEAPGSFSAEARNSQVVLTWTAPSVTGGSSITKYQYRFSVGSSVSTSATWRDVPDGPDAGTSAANETSVRIRYLTNGNQYAFEVRAENADGDSGTATAAETATPSTTPGAPSGVSATPANAGATLRWSAGDTGQSTITGYEYRYAQGTSIGAHVGWTATTSTSATLSGLANGAGYTAEVRAKNANGRGPSARVAFTPRTTPAAPEGLEARTRNSYVELRWSAPASDGGAPITKYQVRYQPDGMSATPWADGTAATTTRVGGLTNKTGYGFQVRAVNAAGAGAVSRVVRTTPNARPSVRDRTITVNQNGSYTFKLEDFGFEDDDGEQLAYVRPLNTKFESRGGIGKPLGAFRFGNQGSDNSNLWARSARASREDIVAGRMTFTPLHGRNGRALTWMTYVASDGQQESNVGRITFDVVGEADNAPVVANRIANATVTVTGETGATPRAQWTMTVPVDTFTDEGRMIYAAELRSGTALPAWIHFNRVTRTFDATITAARVGSYPIRVSATDTKGQTSSTTFILDVTAKASRPTATIAADNTQIDEGGTATFTITLDADAPAGGVTVYYRIEHVDALAGHENVQSAELGAKSVTIPEGDDSVPIAIQTVESTELLNLPTTLRVTLEGGSDYTLGTQSRASTKIQNTTTTTVGMAENCDVEITEGEAVDLTITTEKAIQERMVLNVIGVNASALVNEDFVEFRGVDEGVQVIEALERTTKARARTVDDDAPEPDEYYEVRIVNIAAGGSRFSDHVSTDNTCVADGGTRVTIKDNDSSKMNAVAQKKTVQEGSTINIDAVVVGGPVGGFFDCGFRQPLRATLTPSGNTERLMNDAARTVAFDVCTRSVRTRFETKTIAGDQGSGQITFTLSDIAIPSQISLGPTLSQINVGTTATVTVEDSTPGGLDFSGHEELATTEAGGTDEFEVRLGSAPSAAVTLKATSSDVGEGTVTAERTFSTSNWNTAQTFTVTGVDDNDADGTQTYAIHFAVTSSDTSYSARKVTPITVTNTDNETSGPIVTIDDAADVEEGETASFPLSVANATGAQRPITVSWTATTNGSGVTRHTTRGGGAEPEDIAAHSGSVTIPAGVTSWSVMVDTVEDDVYETDETFSITLTSVRNAVLGTTKTGSGEIQNDEALPRMTMEFRPNVIHEADIPTTPEVENETLLVIGVTRSIEGRLNTTVPVYQSTPYVLKAKVNSAPKALLARMGVRDGEREGTEQIEAVHNDADQEDRALTASASTPFDVGVIVMPNGDMMDIGAPDFPSITIRDVDPSPVPEIVLADESVSEDGGTTTVKVKLDRPSAQKTVVRLDQQPEHFTLSSHKLTVAAGAKESTETVTLTGVPNTIENDTRTVTLTGTATNSLGVRTGDAGTDAHTSEVTISTALTITDDAPVANLVVTPRIISENGGRAVITATLDKPSAAETLVVVGIDPVAPASRTDYRYTTTEFTIPAGVTRATSEVEVEAVDNDADTATRTLTVSGVASNDNGVANPAPVTITIHDDETTATVTLTASPTEVAEGGTTTIRARMSEAASAATTITIADRTDVYTTSGEIVIAAGATMSTGTISLTTPQNTDEDGVRTVQVTGEADSTGNTPTVTALALRVVDDDIGDVIVLDQTQPETVVRTLTLDEGATKEYAIKLAREPSGTARIGVNIQSANARAPKIERTPSRITFTRSNWNTPQRVRIRALPDADTDDESITIGHVVSDGRNSGGAQRVTVNVTDGGRSGITLSSSAVTLEEGQSATYTVSLTRPTTAHVYVRPEVDSPAVLSFEPDELHFPRWDWKTPRTITVTALKEPNSTDDVWAVRHEVRETGENGWRPGSELAVTVTDVVSGPDAPSVTAAGGSGQVTLRWTAPTSTGTSDVARYEVRNNSIGGAFPWTPWTTVEDSDDAGTSESDESATTITELTDGAHYRFELRAVNSDVHGVTAQISARAGVRAPRPSNALVSNLDAAASTWRLNGPAGFDQKFETGPLAVGYYVEGVQIYNAWRGSTPESSITAKLCPEDAAEAQCTALTRAGVDGTAIRFTTPEYFQVDAETVYEVQVRSTQELVIAGARTGNPQGSNDEGRDAGNEAGWVLHHLDPLAGTARMAVLGRPGVPVCNRAARVRDRIIGSVATQKGVAESSLQCADITREDLATLEELAQGSQLLPSSTGGIEISRRDLDGLFGMKTLGLENFAITGIQDGALDQMKGLTSIHIGDSGESVSIAALPRTLLRKNTNLTTFQATKSGLGSLEGLFETTTKLTVLDLTSTGIIGEDLHGQIEHLTGLTSLSLNTLNLGEMPEGILDTLTGLTVLKMPPPGTAQWAEGALENLTSLTDLKFPPTGGTQKPGVTVETERYAAKEAEVEITATVTGLWGSNVDWEWTQVEANNSSTAAGASDRVTAETTIPGR